ncbi:MAG TPA: sodium:proton antiporter [Rickettsiales bacterium]|nr:sodium:proton antiporter [Rickettsiales bacterium]
MSTIIEQTIFLLIVAIIVALAAHRLRLPYTVGLVLTGIVLALFHVSPGLRLTHEFIFDVILPPLLFEAAINLHWKELRRDMFPILLLANAGVIIAALFVTWGMGYFLQWPLSAALAFGVLISATDPVAVIAMFKDTGVTGRLRLLVESESLFNDGVAAVLFAVVLAWTQATGSAAVSPGSVLQAIAFSAGGGILAGAICAYVTMFLAGRASDHLLETALTTVIAYGSFLLAEHLHVSGVLATVTAGLIIGHSGIQSEDDSEHKKKPVSERGKAFILDFWEFAAFLANSIIFLMMGLRVAEIPFNAITNIALPVAILLVLIGRALSVYPLCLPLKKTRWAIPEKYQHVLWWGGLRGALALALVLSLPETIPLHNEIVVVTFTTVAFSVLIQGITMPLLLKFLKYGSSA